MASSNPITTNNDDGNDSESLEMDPELMAAMGFGGFGMQKKPLSNSKSKSNPKTNPKTQGLAASANGSSSSNNGSNGAHGHGHAAKRQKTSSSAFAFASGANGVAVSIRRSRETITKEDAGRSTTAPTTMVAGGEEGEHGDPSYEDSDIEPQDHDLHTTKQKQRHEDLGSRSSREDQRNAGEIDPSHPPAMQRMENGDMAFFLRSFVQDPWEGMGAVPMR